MVETPASQTVVLGSLREQYPEAAMAGGKGQQYIEIVAEYEPLSLGLIYFGAFKNVSQLCWLLPGSSLCIFGFEGVSVCMWKRKIQEAIRTFSEVFQKE